MLHTIKMGCWHSGDEELARIGVRTSIGHRQQARGLVLYIKVLILKLVPVDRIPTEPISSFKVTTLQQKLVFCFKKR